MINLRGLLAGVLVGGLAGALVKVSTGSDLWGALTAMAVAIITVLMVRK